MQTRSVLRTVVISLLFCGSNAVGQVVAGYAQTSGWDYHAFLWTNGVMRDLGTLPGGDASLAYGINAAGQVVGWANTATSHRAFLWSNGVMRDLGTLPGSFWSEALGINAAGQVVGVDAGSNSRAFLWSNGVMQDLGSLPGGAQSQAAGINAAGQVVGWASTSGASGYHAVLWSNGIIRDLGTLPGGTLSQATGINDAGQVVGWSYTTDFAVTHAFLWSNGVMQDLGTLPGDGDSNAEGINAAGQVVGRSGDRAFLWSNGVMRDLGTLPGDTSGGSWAHGVNAVGQVVGECWSGSPFIHAFLWSNGLMQNLGTLGGPTTVATAVADAAVPGLPAPTNLHANQIGNSGTQIQLTWDYGSDPIDGFKVEGKLPSGGSIGGVPPGSDGWVPLTTIAAPGARLMDMNPPNVPTFGTISYRIRAYLGSTTSDTSNEATVFQLKVQSANCGLGGVRDRCTSLVLWPIFSGINNTIYVDFMPDPALLLTQVAGNFHYDHFNWISTVTYLPQSVTEFRALENDPVTHLPGLLKTPPPFFDPPIGGYFNPIHQADLLPYYWDEQQSWTFQGVGYVNVPGYLLRDNLLDVFGNECSSTGLPCLTLNFQDPPHSAQLAPPYCLPPANCSIQFVTSLVGIPAGSAPPTLLATFFWSTNNHISGVGGLADAGSSGSGNGGIFNAAIVDSKDLPLGVRTLLAQAGVQGVPTAAKVDKDAPMTAAFLSGPQGTNGWYTGPVTVTLIATDIDGPSDIAATSYRLDGGAVVAYAAPFTVSGNGIHNISFGSVDRALNAETPPPSQTFKIDTTPPVILPQITGTLGNNGWYRGTVSVTWSVSDPESGIASSTGCTAITLTTDTAGMILTCSASNGAGLSASVPVTIKIDKAPPVISGMPAAGCTLWPVDQKMVTVATVTATDALSGLAAGTFTVTGTSNEPIAPNDPKSPDIVITPNGTGGLVVQLQADRLGTGTGRTYTLTATANDLAANMATVTATCTVPHDQGK